jgi:NAD+ diphosphatase
MLASLAEKLLVEEHFFAPTLPAGGNIETWTVDKSAVLPAGWEKRSVRGFTALADIQDMLRAYHLSIWRRESRFCGTCGCENEDASPEYARKCPRCGRLEFPRISPAVFTLIRNDKGEALLAHNRSFKNGVYSLIAGFVEAGECLEDAVRREIHEEVGLEVKNIRYFASQSWPFPNSLMLGFTADYAAGLIQPDGNEIEDAAWFSAEKLPPLPQGGSIARRIINAWLGEHIAH